MPEIPPDPSPATRLSLRNSREVQIDFTLEPWGEVHPMAPGALFEIVARGPADGFLEVEATQDGLTVYGWSGSIVDVLQDGKPLGGR